MISHGHKLLALVGLVAGLLNLATPTNAVVPPASITLAWDPSPGTGVMGYRVYEGGVSQTYTNTIDVGNATSCTITGLVPGATYFFAVSAYDTNNLESPLSSEISYTVPLTPALLATLKMSLAPGKPVLLTGTAPVGYTFAVESASRLTNWTTLGSVTAGTDGTFQFTDPGSATNNLRFYRMRQTAP